MRDEWCRWWWGDRVSISRRSSTGSSPGPDAIRRYEGSPALHAWLERVDPESARRLHPNDRVRIIRALEVQLKSGQPLSALRRQAAPPSLRARTRYIVLDRDPGDLDARISKRTVALFREGLLDEARGLLASGLGPEQAAYRTIGYREAFAVLRGEMAIAEAIEATSRATRQFARRQRTWFRAVRGASWWLIPPAEAPAVTAERLLGGA
jgi:tRNA dimethylallyltransferase